MTIVKLLLLGLLAASPSLGDEGDLLLEKALDPGAWSGAGGANGPSAKVDRLDDGLRITFAGGRWPAVSTREVPEDWMRWKSLAAEVTVGRACLLGFQAVQERSLPGRGWDALVTRWARTVLLKPGKNDVQVGLEDPSGNGYGLNPKAYGKVTTLEIFFRSPREGEEVGIRRLRLLRERTSPVASATRFKVAGTALEVSNVRELGRLLKDKWTKPEPRTVDQIEAEFRALFGRIREEHPRAVLAGFRDGENGYAGWSDAHVNSHGPDNNTEGRARNTGAAETGEAFMRHRSLLLRADLSSIPKGAAILAARFILVAADAEFEKGRDPRVGANMWVAEPCTRPWVESEVNAYEYAKDRFWKSVGGMGYGDDPDFLPLYLAHGPGNAPASSWDFTEAVRFWTDGEHPNQGFFLHGDSFHYMGQAYSREAREIRNRPAILVVYEPR